MFLEMSKWPHFNSFLVSWLHFFSKIPLIPWDIHATNFLFVFLCNLDIYIFLKLALVPPDIHITYFLIFSSILARIYLLFLRYPHYLWFKKIFFLYLGSILFSKTIPCSRRYLHDLFLIFFCILDIFFSRTTSCLLRYPFDLLFDCFFLLFCVVGPVRLDFRERMLWQTVAKILLILNCDVV